MATWKDRGYVPDSDDEDDLPQHIARVTQYNKTGNDAQGPGEIDTFVGKSTAQRLEESLNHGLSLVRKALSINGEDVSLQGTEDDSPLSSLSSSPSVPPTAPIPTVILLSPTALEPDFPTTQYRSRNLRQRTAIQQNPYSLEDAKYRQQFQERGLRPVRTHRQPSPELGKAAEESQTSDPHTSTQVTSQSDFSSLMREETFISDSFQAPGSDLAPLYDDIDLPDLSAIIANPNSTSRLLQTDKKVSKRSASTSTQVRGQSSKLRLYKLRSSQDDKPKNSKQSKHESKIPSPPPSDTLFSSASHPAEEFWTRTASPAALPTPLVSSEAHSRKRLVISDDSASESHSTQTSATSGDAQMLDFVSSEDDSQQVQVVARKTKGVLPASWLRLDKARQLSKSVRQPRRRHSSTAVAEKGVALKKVRTNWNVSGSDRNTIEALQSSDTEAEMPPERQLSIRDALSKHSPGTRLGEFNEDEQDLDISEEDDIDRMLPSMGNPKRSITYRRKNQESVRNSLSDRVSAYQTGASNITQSRPERRSRNAAGTKQPPKKRKISAPKHMITILNAPGLQSPTKEHQPRFLRIAARNAHRSRQPKPVKPRRQMFSLATAEDNGDIDNAFDMVNKQALVTALERPVRYDESHSGVSVPKVRADAAVSHSRNTLANLKASSETILQRQSRGHVSPSVQAPVLEAYKPFLSHGLHLTRLRTLLPLTNRSGRGHIVSRASTFRIAQVEAPGVSREYRPRQNTVQRRNGHESQKTIKQLSVQVNSEHGLEPSIPQKQPRKRRPLQRRLVVNPDSGKGQNSEKRLVVELDTQEHLVAQPGLRSDQEQCNVLAKLTKLRDASFDLHALETLYSDLPAFTIPDYRHEVKEDLESPIDDSWRESVTLPLTNLKEAECRNLDCWTSWSAKTFMDNYSALGQYLDEHEPPRSEEEHTRILSVLNQMLDFAQTKILNASGSDATAFLEVSYDGLYKISQSLLRQNLESHSYPKSMTILLNRILLLSEKACAIERRHYQILHLAYSGEKKLPEVRTSDLQLASQTLRRIFEPTALLAWFEACTIHLTDGTTVSADVLLQGEALLLAIRAYQRSERGLEQFWHDTSSIINARNSALNTTLLYTLLAIAFIMSLSSYIHKYVPGAMLQYHEIPQMILADLLNKNRDTASRQGQEAKLDSQRTRLLVFSILCKMWRGYGWKPMQKVLLAWFQDCQKFWFSDHTDSKSSHVHSHKENSFQLFLQALALHVDKTYEEDSESAIQKLRSVLFSLTPNRGRIGEQGQIGEKTRTLDVRDVQLVRNIFDLHVEMIRLAPRFAPRVRTLELKVDFSTAHLAICRVALSAWKSLASKQEHEVTSDLSSWYQTMIHQSIQRWHLAESEIRKELAETPHRFSAKTIKDIITANQEEASELTSNIIESLAPQAHIYVEADHTRSEFICELAHSVLQIPSSEPVLTERLAVQALEAVKVAVGELGRSMSSRLVPAMVKGMKQSILTQLGGRAVPCARLTRLCIELYVDVARVAVALRHNHWDEFLSPSSSYALGMLVDRTKLNDSTTIFYARFVDAEPSIFALECRSRVFDHWLHNLLRSGAEHSFVSLLTRSIFQHETESLMLTELSSEYKGSDGSFNEAAIEQNFSRVQRTVVKHIIRQIHAQESEPEADWLIGGLEEADALKLLSTIFSTLKTTWLSLNTQQEKKVEYECFIDDVLAEYEVFPRQDFKLDPWFYGALSTTARRKYSLNRAFELRSGRRDLSYSQHDIARTFSNELVQAISSDKSDELLHKLEEIFLPTELGLVTEDSKAGRYAVDLKAQADFISTEFPKLILPAAGVNDRDSAKTALLCELLCYMLGNLELRIDSLDLDTVMPLLSAVQSVISTVCQAVDGGIGEHPNVFKLTRLAFDWLVRLNVDSVSQQFWDDVETLCTVAAVDGSLEAMQLLETVMERS